MGASSSSMGADCKCPVQPTCKACAEGMQPSLYDQKVHDSLIKELEACSEEVEELQRKTRSDKLTQEELSAKTRDLSASIKVILRGLMKRGEIQPSDVMKIQKQIMDNVGTIDNEINAITSKKRDVEMEMIRLNTEIAVIKTELAKSTKSVEANRALADQMKNCHVVLKNYSEVKYTFERQGLVMRSVGRKIKAAESKLAGIIERKKQCLQTLPEVRDAVKKTNSEIKFYKLRMEDIAAKMKAAEPKSSERCPDGWEFVPPTKCRAVKKKVGDNEVWVNRGECSEVSNFDGYSRYQKEQWANSCKVAWKAVQQKR